MLFDYGEYYSNCGEEDKWISKEGCMYAVMFKTSSLEEITYSVIVDRISKKVGVAESTAKLKLSYIPIVVKTQRRLYILDDEDVSVYLTSLDKEQRRSVLNVEVVEVSKDVELNELGEQFSRLEHVSSFGVNYGDNGRAIVGVNDGNVGVNDGVIAIYTENCSTEQHHEPIENANCENVDGENVDGENASREDGDNDEDNGLESSRRLEIVEFPHSGEEQQVVDAWEDGMGLKVGQEFASKQELIYVIDRASHQNCFGITLSKSDKSRYVLKCGEDGCNWYLRATKATNATLFTVRVYKKMHTCSRATSSTSSKQRKGTPGLVAGIVSELYPAPKILVVLVQGNASVNVSYSTAWRGKQKALSMVRGSPEESYNDLYSYLYMLEQVNPDTRTSVLLDEQKRFKYVFVSLGACIEGFRAMRKVIIVDATFLKNQHGGVLIFATARDPNHHHYPIAFDVVDAENNASWNWFFNTLKTVIPDSPELVFVSDRNASLIKAIGEVYPSSKHGYCIFRISQNVRLHVRRDKDVVAEKFRDCARLYTEAEFLEAYSELRKTYPNVGKYLDGSVDEAKWARCYFPGERFNIDTSNCVESMNNTFLDARKYSLLPMIDAIVAKLAGWFNKHRNESVASSDAHKLVLFVENIVHGRVAIARKLSVSELNYFHLEYSVIGRDGKTYLVNLRRKTCDCKCFDIDKYPCVHAIAATIVFMKQPGRTEDIHVEELCWKYYLMETWALAYYRTIYLVSHMSQWIIPDHIQQVYALPPDYKKRGRRQITRHPSVGERRRRTSNRHVRGQGEGLFSYFNCSRDSMDSSEV